MQPKISIIVPVYKAEAYLHRCVDSILAQTFTDFEVLLVDDGSPDKSGEICDEYARKDSRVRVFHKPNGGVSSARQCGIEKAKGEYTIHADPDDWVESTMLEELYNKAKTDDADMVICDFYVNYPNRQLYQKQEPTSLEHSKVLCELFLQLHGSCWNKLLRRACYMKYNVSFDKDLSFCEDLYFHATLLKNSIKISYLPKAYYHYDQIINTDSIVRKYNKETYEYDSMLYNKFMKLLENTDALSFAQYNMGYVMVNRAFFSNTFSTFEFKMYFGKFKNCVLMRKQQMKDNNLLMHCLAKSCEGNYELIYKIYIFLANVKKTIRWTKAKIMN